MPETASHPRYALLDELRGAAIILMVVYHAFYLLAFVFGSRAGRTLFDFMGPVQPFIAGTFILLCGVCCRFSRSNLRRGLKLAGAAALVTLATLAMKLFGVDEVIRFGVLHFLACAVLLFALLERLPGKLPPLPQIIIFAALFFVWRFVPPPLPPTDFFPLYALGFPSSVLRSADYFPLLPWIFLFLAGTAIGIYAKQGRFPRWCVKSRVPALAWLGRHSLLIYLLHQPLLFGVFGLLGVLTGK
ncbi:MAG: DUF1624 domain-containing protein [Firmicutes bacterium]|nr:DUF1624 domain-containing protein [Bacillota bacterium]